MKLLRIIPSIDPKTGGPAEAARRMDVALTNLGHSIELASLDAPETGIDQYPVPVNRLGTGAGGYGYGSALLPWLRANRERFDAVVVDGLWQYSGWAAWRAFAHTETPYFVFAHGMLDPWFKRTYPRKHLKKWLYWPWAEYRVLRDAAAVLFTCEEEKILARQSFWLYQAREQVTSFGTADVPTHSPALIQKFFCAFPELQGKRVLLFLGRIQEKKGCDLLIEAFSRLTLLDDRLHLVMAGPAGNVWKAHLQSMASRLGVSSKITWTGMLSGDLKWGAFQACELFCLPSHQENFGIAVVEAMACARPVTVSNKVNIWREIAEDKAGWVGDDTVAGTFEALLCWFESSPSEVKASGMAARRSFEQRFHIHAAAIQLASIVEERIGQKLSNDDALGVER